MNRSMMASIGIASTLALSAAASGALPTPKSTFAEVIASKPITETIKRPRQECRNITLTHRLAGQEGMIRMKQAPDPTIPVKDGKLVIDQPKV